MSKSRKLTQFCAEMKIHETPNVLCGWFQVGDYAGCTVYHLIDTRKGRSFIEAFV